MQMSFTQFPEQHETGKYEDKNSVFSNGGELEKFPLYDIRTNVQPLKEKNLLFQ